LVRLMGGGLLKPKNQILGADLAGRVEAVGRNVTQFQPGDEDFTQNEQRYNLILAANGYHSIWDYKRALSPRGIYVMTGGSMA